MGIVARQSIKGTVATYVGVAVGIVTTFFIQTKALQPEQIGLIDVLLQCSILFAGLSQLGTSSSAMRYYPFFKDEESRDHGFFGWTLLVPVVGFIVFLSLFFAFKGTIVDFFSKDSGMPDSSLFGRYVYFVIPLAFFMLYITVFETNSNLLLRIVLPKFVREVGLRVATLVVYLLYFYKIIDFDGVIVAFCIFYGLATLINIIYLLSLKRVSFKIDRHYVSKHLKRDFIYYTLFMIAAAVAGTAIPMLSKFLLAGMEGFRLAGVFTIATNIAALVEMPYRSLGAISRPHVSEAMANHDVAKADGLCKNVALHQWIAGLFVLFFIWINIDFLFDLLPNGEVYRLGKWAVLILAIGRLVYSTLDVSLTALSYSKYYYYSLAFTLLLAVLSVVLNRWFIPLWDINGAALANVLSYLVYFLLLLVFIRWKVGVLALSKRQLAVAAIVLVLFGLNALWTLWLTPWLSGLFANSLLGLAVDAVLKSLLFLSVGLTALYKLKVSQSVNDLIDKMLLVLKRK
ncbi:MAG: polysaccharide biosynthesis C-terminal domain-containing protein [Bacteroidales bacterium]|nr:polysaccharide biosynthesis C-terminal domain-containing protein [Bacteroidales bacterium]